MVSWKVVPRLRRVRGAGDEGAVAREDGGHARAAAKAREEDEGDAEVCAVVPQLEREVVELAEELVIVFVLPRKPLGEEGLHPRRLLLLRRRLRAVSPAGARCAAAAATATAAATLAALVLVGEQGVQQPFHPFIQAVSTNRARRLNVHLSRFAALAGASA
jgi:hypothetical protein